MVFLDCYIVSFVDLSPPSFFVNRPPLYSYNDSDLNLFVFIAYLD